MSPLAIAGLGTHRAAHHPGRPVLLFGAKKLPELARGSGRALRIFKAETKGLMDDDDDDDRRRPSSASSRRVRRELAQRREPSRHRARNARDDTTA